MYYGPGTQRAIDVTHARWASGQLADAAQYSTERRTDVMAATLKVRHIKNPKEEEIFILTYKHL